MRLLRVPCGLTAAPLWLTRGAALALPFPAHSAQNTSLGSNKKTVWRGTAADSSGHEAITTARLCRIADRQRGPAHKSQIPRPQIFWTSRLGLSGRPIRDPAAAPQPQWRSQLYLDFCSPLSRGTTSGTLGRWVCRSTFPCSRVCKGSERLLGCLGLALVSLVAPFRAVRFLGHLPIARSGGTMAGSRSATRQVTGGDKFFWC